MTRKTLSDSEKQTLIHALHVAAEVFDKDAQSIHGLPHQVTDDKYTTSSDCLAQQFEKQATETRTLAEKLEQVDHVEVSA